MIWIVLKVPLHPNQPTMWMNTNEYLWVYRWYIWTEHWMCSTPQLLLRCCTSYSPGVWSSRRPCCSVNGAASRPRTSSATCVDFSSLFLAFFSSRHSATWTSRQETCHVRGKMISGGRKPCRRVCQRSKRIGRVWSWDWQSQVVDHTYSALVENITTGPFRIHNTTVTQKLTAVTCRSRCLRHV